MGGKLPHIQNRILLSLSCDLLVGAARRGGRGRLARGGDGLRLGGRRDLVTTSGRGRGVLHLPLGLAELTLVDLAGEAERAHRFEVGFLSRAQVDELVSGREVVKVAVGGKGDVREEDKRRARCCKRNSP